MAKQVDGLSVGIDLGMRYSCIGYYRFANEDDGAFEIIAKTPVRASLPRAATTMHCVCWICCAHSSRAAHSARARSRTSRSRTPSASSATLPRTRPP